MNNPTTKLFAAAALLATIVAGCNCDPGTKRRAPSIEERETLVNFGTVQVDVTHERELIIYNGGASSLTISSLEAAAPFGTKDELPVIVGVGEEFPLIVTFTPTEPGKLKTGTLYIKSDDPERAEVAVTLQGKGITAVATATPNPIAFGDVYLGESKTISLTIHNGGDNDLVVHGATFAQGTPPTVTADLSKIAVNVPAQGTTTTDVAFAPTTMGAIEGAIVLDLDEVQGDELLIPISGTGIQAIPQLCFQFEGEGMARCTDANAVTGGNTTQVLDFGALCDRAIYPMDAGTNPCGDVPFERTALFWVSNAGGNHPVSYSMQYKAALKGTACDGGTTDPDYHFANNPDGGVQWNEPTVQLPAGGESAKIAITYRPTSSCIDDAADRGEIWWTRQGEPVATNRKPSMLITNLAGGSLLPNAKEAGETFQVIGTALPLEQPFKGVINQGNAPFQVKKVDLYEVLSVTPGQSCNGPDAGIFQPCDHSNPLSDCYHLAWADGGVPNATAPHNVPAATDGGYGSTVLGKIVFGAKGSPGPIPRCVYAVIETTDPYNRIITSRIQATAN